MTYHGIPGKSLKLGLLLGGNAFQSSPDNDSQRGQKPPQGERNEEGKTIFSDRAFPTPGSETIGSLHRLVSEPPTTERTTADVTTTAARNKHKSLIDVIRLALSNASQSIFYPPRVPRSVCFTLVSPRLTTSFRPMLEDQYR